MSDLYLQSNLYKSSLSCAGTKIIRWCLIPSKSDVSTQEQNRLTPPFTGTRFDTESGSSESTDWHQFWIKQVPCPAPLSLSLSFSNIRVGVNPSPRHHVWTLQVWHHMYTRRVWYLDKVYQVKHWMPKSTVVHYRLM